MTGFFSPATTSKKPTQSLIPKCGACGLFKTCISPKMPVTGDGERRVLVVAEAPGQKEDERNKQLIGDAGQLLRKALDKLGVSLDVDCWKTNAIICRPPKNREPTHNEIDHCRPNLNKAILELQPDVIIPLGTVAIRSLIGPLWREDPGGINRWAGWRIPSQVHNAWIAPTFHPSHVLRSKDDQEGAAVRIWFERHLRAAVALEGKPYTGAIPDYRREVEIELDPDRAAKRITTWIRAGGPAAFDYETNRLKPDHPNSEIVSCAICWRGRETIAYPWVGAAIEATKQFLVSDMPKIGYNAKFETRWSRAIAKVDVNNWVWDGMLNAHILDNRKAVSGLKFQSFVRLGCPDWSDAVRPYLEDEDETGRNRIKEVPLRTLLTYNGLDAMIEFEVARLQRRELHAK